MAHYQFHPVVYYAKVYALGGCAKIDEAFLGIPKMTGQAKTVAANIVRAAAGQALAAHKEAEPGMTNAPVVQVGRHTFMALVPEVMGGPGALVKCCGPPLNALCPCYLACACCGPCGGPLNALLACGPPCGNPEGRATANCLRTFMASGFFPKDALNWKGLGKPRAGGAPPVSSMARD